MISSEGYFCNFARFFAIFLESRMHYYESPSEELSDPVVAAEFCGFHLENSPRIEGDTTAMHRGRSQNLNKVQHFLTRRGRRRHDRNVRDITINPFPYRR